MFAMELTIPSVKIDGTQAADICRVNEWPRNTIHVRKSTIRVPISDATAKQHPKVFETFVFKRKRMKMEWLLHYLGPEDLVLTRDHKGRFLLESVRSKESDLMRLAEAYLEAENLAARIDCD